MCTVRTLRLDGGIEMEARVSESWDGRRIVVCRAWWILDGDDVPVVEEVTLSGGWCECDVLELLERGQPLEYCESPF